MGRKTEEKLPTRGILLRFADITDSYRFFAIVSVAPFTEIFITLAWIDFFEQTSLLADRKWNKIEEKKFARTFRLLHTGTFREVFIERWPEKKWTTSGWRVAKHHHQEAGMSGHSSVGSFNFFNRILDIPQSFSFYHQESWFFPKSPTRLVVSLTTPIITEHRMRPGQWNKLYCRHSSEQSKQTSDTAARLLHEQSLPLFRIWINHTNCEPLKSPNVFSICSTSASCNARCVRADGTASLTLSFSQPACMQSIIE